MRGRYGCLVDLAYGPSPGERLDLFPVPAAQRGDTRAPLVAFIHGGYWQSLDKGDFGYLAPALLDRGIAFASLNYDLAPRAGIPDMVAQIRRALAWLYDAAAQYGIDRERIFVAGHSAGGHLAATALDRAWTAEHDLPEDAVKGGLSISGVYDLEPMRLSYHQSVLQLDADTVEDYSPLRCLPRNAGPLLLAVGADETREFLLQQQAFAAAWRGAGLRAAEVDMPGRHHFDAVDAMGEPDHPLFAALLRLVETQEID